MAEQHLTYRAAGVDVKANNEANERIKRLVRRTHGRRVLTRPGLFGGALSLRGLAIGARGLRLVGSLGFSQHRGATPGPEAAGARDALEICRRKLPPSTRPLAFLDYLAAERLSPVSAEALVRGFAEQLARRRRGGRVPLIGGETAEMPSTFRPDGWEVVGALFGLAADPGGNPAAGLGRLEGCAHPALVFTMDGVGTKTRLAVEAHRTGGLALDILHHSLNDVLCEGAEGLAVLFYVGCHSADPALLEPLLASVQTACRGLGLVLLEAAVAEKPELYREGEYDVCACLAGTVDAQSLVQGSEVGDGDLMIGLGSSGLHTNGYSLARRALLERGGLELGDGLAELGSTLGEALLAPHHNYAPAVLPVLRDPALGAAIHGVAHITGGGLGGNLVRVVPPGLTATVRLSSWEPPALFRLIQRAGGIPDSDAQSSGMYEAFNMGIGLVLIVDPDRAEAVSARLAGAGEQTRVIGSVHRQPGLGSRRRAASPGRVELLR